MTQVNNTAAPISEAKVKKQIASAIRGLEKRYLNARDTAQEIGVAIITHANEYGDCTLAANLTRALPKQSRSQMIKWFAQYSPINVTMGKTRKDDKARYHKDDAKAYNVFNLDGAKANNWYDMQQEAKPASELKTLESFYTGLQGTIARTLKDCAKEEGSTFAPQEQEAVREACIQFEAALKKIKTSQAATLVTNNDDDTNVADLPEVINF